LIELFDLEGYLPLILTGTWVTIKVALCSLFVALSLGILTALGRLSSSKIWRSVAGVYTTVIRGIPDLVLLTLIFYGGQILVNKLTEALDWGYLDVNPFIAGVLTIGFIFGAYMGETFRGAILAVPRGEIEAGLAYGMSSSKVFVRVTLPAMIRHALPGFGNNWLVLMKSTALVSVIGLHDMVYSAGLAGGSTRKPFTFFLVVALLYLILTAVSNWGIKTLDKRHQVPSRPANV
jgi:arginine/ornithine transport system permease protein